MAISPLAGKLPPDNILINVDALKTAYYQYQLNLQDPSQRVKFGTSGHRGSPLDGSFNKPHILAMTQAVCEVRARAGIKGPLFLGMDSHAVSQPAFQSALEVLIANDVDVVVQKGGGYTPTPVISHAILTYNSIHPDVASDGIVITPSHNPPADGGFKYNPPTGGPASAQTTTAIETRANELLQANLNGVKRESLSTRQGRAYDYIKPYVDDLQNVLDMSRISEARTHIGVNPLGGAAVAFWEPIAERYKLNLEVTNRQVDPTFRFMTVDKDGKIRMDCSSPYAMASLIAEKDKFDIAFGNDTDADRHGIVTPDGLMNPNHYLTVAIWYLFRNRPNWSIAAAVGKTVVSSSMIDRVAAKIGRKLVEVPVGFKWFVDGLVDGSFGFGGEESAGASFLRKSGKVWTTDKDGIILGLLAAEIVAVTGKTPSQHYRDLCAELGNPAYERLDAPVNDQQRRALNMLTVADVHTKSFAGEPVTSILDHAPGNGAAIGGLKLSTTSGWFAVRPSGTENVYKLYAESFKGEAHLRQIQIEAQALIEAAVAKKS